MANKDRASNPPLEKPGVEAWLVSPEQLLLCQFKADAATVHAQWVMCAPTAACHHVLKCRKPGAKCFGITPLRRGTKCSKQDGVPVHHPSDNAGLTTPLRRGESVPNPATNGHWRNHWMEVVGTPKTPSPRQGFSSVPMRPWQRPNESQACRMLWCGFSGEGRFRLGRPSQPC